MDPVQNSTCKDELKRILGKVFCKVETEGSLIFFHGASTILILKLHKDATRTKRGGGEAEKKKRKKL